MYPGYLTMLVLTLHNLPEGLATFAATLSSPAFGMSLAFAIGLHNIPEGLAVGMCYLHVYTSMRKLRLCTAVYTWIETIFRFYLAMK